MTERSSPGSQVFDSQAAKYGFALLSAAAAIFVRRLLDPILGSDLPLVTLFGAATFAVWFAGWRPAVLASLAGYLAANYLFIPPRYAFLLTSPATWFGFVAYAVSCGLIIYLGETMRRSNQRLRMEIIERRAAEQLVRSGEARFAGIVDSAMDAIIAVDESQRIQAFNRAAEQIFRCPASDALGQALDKFIPERFRQAHRRHVQDFGHTGVTNRSMSRPGTLWGLRSDGEEFPIEATISQVETDGQKLFTVILRDISERVRAERLVRESEERLRAMYEHAPVGIEQVSLDGRLLMVNPALAKMLDYEQSELMSKTIEQITHPDDLPGEKMLIEELMNGARNFYHFEKRYLKADGTPLWGSVSSSLVRIAAGEPVYRVSVVENITERRQTQEALRKAEALAATGRMAATLAHEINNPLAAITNLAYLLRFAPRLPKDLRQHAELLDEQLTRLGHIVRQTLNLYRPQAAPPLAVPLSEVVDELLELYEAKLRGFAVEKRYDANCFVTGNRTELHQLVSNLLLNAVEAVPNGHGVIKIRVCRSCDWQNPDRRGVRLIVADSGPGIPPEVQPHVFQPFFTTKQQKGTGLGLFVVQWVATKHRGSVRVRSSTRPGRNGTCVSVFLCPGAPAKKAPPTADANPAAQSQAS